MRILLTGASGFIGQYVLASLQKHGISTAVLGRAMPAGVSPANFIQADLLDGREFDTAVAQSDATHLLHLAWHTEHGNYRTSPLNLRWAEATVRLVEAFCHAGGQKVVVAGTCAEYDWSCGYCHEDITPANPSTLYGIAKDATRRLTMAVCSANKTPCAWGRIFLPYGKGEDRRRLIPSLVEVFQGKRQPFGVNAAAYRDFLHASDLAEGFIKLIQSDASGIYNVCSGEPARIGDVVRQIAQSFKKDPQTVLALSAERPGEPLMLAGNNRKLKLLGWRQAHPLSNLQGYGEP